MPNQRHRGRINMSLLGRAAERTSELGCVGRYLQTQLAPEDLAPNFISMGVVGQLVELHKKYLKNRKDRNRDDIVYPGSVEGVGQLKACAASMLLCDFPVQIGASVDVVKEIILNAFEPLPTEDRLKPDYITMHMNNHQKTTETTDQETTKRKKEETVNRKKIKQMDSFTLRDESKERWFPLKAHTAAVDKANVWATDVINHLYTSERSLYNEFDRHKMSMLGMTNDQAAACMMMGIGLQGEFANPAALAIKMVRNPKDAKALTIVLKGLGRNILKVGAVCCEANVLQGRGIGELDLHAECLERVGDAGRAKSPQVFDDDTLRKAVRHVIDRELRGRQVEFMEKDDFWSRRWIWCVNGGHSRALEHAKPRWKVTERGHIHRRVAAESWSENPLDHWDGDVYVSASSKLEHGKTRLLLACDTVSYVCFEHMLRPVEQAWRNERVLLDPGKPGAIGICEKVRALKGGVNVMMDYDDFNAQHTIRAMEIVFEQLAAATGYSDEYAQRLIDSFRKMHISAAGKYVGIATGTLMSGHRATTFINSVLNAAYILAAAPQLYNKFDSLHTGDDVVSRFSSYEDVDTILASLKRVGLKLNPMKQSVGTECAEFLRMAIGTEAARGYLARAIASLVSGNWVTPASLEPNELLTTVITGVRACINRSGTLGYAKMMARPVSRRCNIGRDKITRLLNGSVALGAGPVYKDGASAGAYVAQITKTYRDTLLERVANRPINATQEYLAAHVSVVEREGLQRAKADVVGLMREASYAKSLIENEGKDYTSAIRLVRQPAQMMRGLHHAERLNKVRPVQGVLERFPLLQLVKNQLTATDLQDVLALVGIQTSITQAREVAWGGGTAPKVIRGIIPYGDAAALCNRCTSGIICVNYPIYM